MSDIEATSIPPLPFVECGLCKGNKNISWFCKNCPTSLCELGASTHRLIPQYEFHTVLPRTYAVLRLYGPAELAEQCTIHPEKEISSYCNDCNVTCCVTCMVKDHKRHDFSTIEDEYLDAEKRLNDYHRHLDTDVRSTLDKYEEQARNDVNESNKNVEKVIHEIQDFRIDVVENFNKACDDLIAQVQVTSSKSAEDMRAIENAWKRFESVKKEIEGKIENGRLDLIHYAPPIIGSLIPKHVKSNKLVAIFKPAYKVLEAIQESVGIIEVKEIQKNKEVTVNVQETNSFHVKLGTTSLTTASNNMAWILNYSSPIIYLYNDMGEEVKSITVNGSKGINDMAITKSGAMIVTCVDMKVRCISVDAEVSTLIETAPLECKGVCLTDKEDIVICMTDQGDRNCVAIYSPDGRYKLREIRDDEDRDNRLITNPYRVVQNGHDLCIVNRGSDVLCVDERGNMRWVYDGMQAQLDDPFNPRCICADQYLNLLVTDRMNNCVHYIDKEGGLIQLILTQEEISLTDHNGICIDKDEGYVWVGNSNFIVETEKWCSKFVIARYLD